MKLVASSVRRAGRTETVTSVLYGIGCASWFVASGRFNPLWNEQSDQRLALLVCGSFMIVIVNLVEMAAALRRFSQERKNPTPKAASRADTVVAFLMLFGSLGLLLAAILAILDANPGGRYRELYDASFFVVSGAVLNVVFSTDSSESDGTSRTQLLTNSMLALHAVGATFFTSGTLLHATMSAESCHSGFLIGSYLNFLASCLFLTSSFLNYFRTRDLVYITRSTDRSSRSGSLKKKKKGGKGESGALAGSSFAWLPFSSSPTKEVYDEESASEESRPPKKTSKSKSRRPRD